MLDLELAGEGEDEDADIDTDISIITAEERSIFYGLYSKLRSYLFHYNTVKLRYKLLASTWMFAAFIAFGVVLSGEEVGLPFPTMVSIILLNLLASTGITLIWILDTIVYYRILGAIFTATLDLENKYPSFLGVHHNFLILEEHKKQWISYDGLFYAGYLFILGGIGTIALYLSLAPSGWKRALVFSFFFAILELTVQTIVYLKSQQASAAVIYKEHPSYKRFW